jgi:hypothetical protein
MEGRHPLSLVYPQVQLVTLAPFKERTRRASVKRRAGMLARTYCNSGNPFQGTRVHLRRRPIRCSRRREAVTLVSPRRAKHNGAQLFGASVQVIHQHLPSAARCPNSIPRASSMPSPGCRLRRARAAAPRRAAVVNRKENTIRPACHVPLSASGASTPLRYTRYPPP